MDRHPRLMLFSMALVLIALIGCSRLLVFAANENEALNAIAVAEERIAVCYAAVAGADEVGADASHLLARLDEAGVLLSRAKLHYALDDFDSAYEFANESASKLSGFGEEANALTEKAFQEHYWGFWITVGGSAGGTLAVAGGGLATWLLLKRRYSEGAHG